MPLCGDSNATVLEPDRNGVSPCYRSIVYVGPAVLLGLLGCSFAAMQELKLKVRTYFPLRMVLPVMGWADWLRLALFWLVASVNLWSWLFERAQAWGHTSLAPYELLDLVGFGMVCWGVMCSSWLLHEVRRGSEEWSWLRVFTVAEVVGESLRLWSESMNLDEDYRTAGARELALVRGVTMLALKATACFAMVCFNRNWRKLRQDLRASATRAGLATSDSFFHGGDMGSSSQLIPALGRQGSQGSFAEWGRDENGDASDGAQQGGQADQLQGAETGQTPAGKFAKLERTPEQYAGLLSRLCFFWMEPLMRSGFTREVGESDFYKVLRADETQRLSKDFTLAFKKTHAQAQARKAAAEARVTPLEQEPESELRQELLGASGAASGAGAQASTAGAQAAAAAKVGDLWTIAIALHRAGILRPFYEAAAFKIVYDLSMFAGPQVLRKLIQFLSRSADKPDADMTEGYEWVALMFFVSLLQTFVLHIYFHKVFRAGMRVRAALVASIYRKALRLSPAAKQERTTGEVVNLMSTDCERLNGLFPYLHVTWSSPLQVALALYFLWAELKYAVLVAVAVIFLLMTPLTALVAGRIKTIQQELMKVKDTRIRAAGEVITSMKIIKLYGWERTFRDNVAGARENELALLRRYVLWRAAARTLWNVTPTVVTLATFASFVGFNIGELDPATAFTSLSLLNILRFPLAMLPNIFNSLLEAMVSLKRIASFLEAQEIDLAALERARRAVALPPGVAVLVRDGTFYWDEQRKKRALGHVDLTVPQGALAVVFGGVGSGKSALLSALIGELQPEVLVPQPAVGVQGSIAYAPQVPWILNATVRDNILFGRAMDREWYDRTVRACALVPDMEQLPEGDLTEIGERGINLSGGQKARISLARAVYARADVLLLENCFEAVDEHVGVYLWENCMMGALREPARSGKRPTVLLVTHALKFVRQSDLVLCMDKGRLVAAAPPDEMLRDASSELSRLVKVLQQQQQQAGKDRATSSGDEVASPKGEGEAASKPGAAAAAATAPPALRRAGSFSKGKDAGAGNLTGKEERAVGQVSSEVYKMYMDAVGGALVVVAVNVGLLLRTSMDSGTSAWLAYWSNQVAKTPHEDHIGSSNLSSSYDTADSSSWAAGWSAEAEARRLLEPAMATMASSVATATSIGLESLESLSAAAGGSAHGSGYYLGIYAALSLLSIVFAGALTVYIALVSLHASRAMHSRMLHAVCRSPMAFFDTTPIGRILNRFSKDVYTIDETLPDSMFSFLSTVFTVIGTVGTIAFVTPQFLLVLPILAVAYLRIQRYYIATSRQVKRWDSVLRSPIFSHFTESLDGLSSIRAYAAARRFVRTNQEQLEAQNSAYYVSISMNRWLAVRLEFIGTMLVLSTSLFVVLFRSSHSAGLGAMAISYALSITQTLNWTVRMSSEVETNVVSVERVAEYAKLEPEAAEETPEDPPRGQWPSSGQIVFEDLAARYRPGLDEVLKGVNLHIRAGSRVGVVGRTGSGKSTLLLVLFRIIEPSRGRVLIDGQDISKLGLQRLRESLSIIPQDPLLVAGTLRYNLDPAKQASETDLWRVLDLLNLRQHVEALAKDGKSGLDSMVAEGGANWSVGQRQIICIARALLRRSPVICLDEATSNIDAATDELIQRTIRSEFKHATLIMIAHRLTTIADADQVVCMDQGRVAECDSPAKLLANKRSHFALLMQQMSQSSTLGTK